VLYNNQAVLTVHVTLLHHTSRVRLLCCPTQ